MINYTDTSPPASQQMRQKSKQLAKIEATQKLEQVKKEQLQQQRMLANQRQSEHSSSESNSPTQQQEHSQSRQSFDDVFLKPQAPPPSGFSSLPHSPHASSPLHQPPSSPQMFSPPSSRPSSPWDPYSKVVGTPRPASSSQTCSSSAPQQQHRNSLNASPAHDAFGSPALSPDSKAAEMTRTLGQQQPGNSLVMI